MTSNWGKYSRRGLDVASTATSLGFSAAKAGTKLGFSLTRGIASTAAGLTGSVLDHALFGGSIGVGPLLGGAVSTAISTIESLALAPILIGESLTSTSFVAAQSTLSVLATIFPGSDEASFSLASFAGLVRREWSEPVDSEGLPEERYGLAETMKALAGWATLQGVTGEWQERQWFKHMQEIVVNDEEHLTTESSDAPPTKRQRVDSRVHITTDVVYPSHGGQIVTADIGEALSTPSFLSPVTPKASQSPTPGTRLLLSHSELKQTLRRLSKLVLAGYGGPSLLFFGVSPWATSKQCVSSSSSSEDWKEVDKLADAVDASEIEASSSARVSVAQPESGPGRPSYSWWNVLMGRHDYDIFMEYANAHPPSAARETLGDSGTAGNPQPRPATAFIGNERLMPRFWVLTDHVRREVVLVIRGTMSLNELAVDLTCDTAPFELHTSSRREAAPSFRGDADAPKDAAEEARVDEDEGGNWSEFDEGLESIPGSFPMDLSTPSPPKRPSRPSETVMQPQPLPPTPDEEDAESHLVHGGILKMARAMGAPGKSVHVAVRDALKRNRGYSLILCGHSLGAGVAALLALMWADPETRLTHRRSGLPRRRLVSAFCFAPPCLTSPRLGALARESGLITSFVYSHDVVSRLSLGSVRDLKRGAMWLCKAEDAGKDKEDHEGYSGVTKRALKWKAGLGEEGDEEWFLAIRKTLEANMHMVQLFPPGRVFWALRDDDLHIAHRVHNEGGGGVHDLGGEKVRLFEVLDVERVFGQIVFARDMLSSHLPHQYDRVLHQLL
ncbi:hypothetical protein AcW2_006890 [Taiwanofungus camphoratus]|nr:hypothetical protein AcW2_006890 [Antrodia cinnamomea]